MSCLESSANITISPGECGLSIPTAITIVQIPISKLTLSHVTQLSITSGLPVTVDIAALNSQLSASVAPEILSTKTCTQSVWNLPLATLCPTTVPGRLDPPAAVGIAIGCAIAGALITVAIFFLYFGLRRRKRSQHKEDDGYPSKMLGQKKTVLSTIAISRDSVAAVIESNLPQPLEDAAISRAFSKISENINSHVVSFYNNDHNIDHNAVAQAIFQTIGTDFPLSVSHTRTLLENSRTRPVILRAVLARIIVRRMDLQCPEKDSFLPAVIPTALQSMKWARDNSGNRSKRINCYFPNSANFYEFIWHS
jgi:hypothetical protein